MTHSAADSPLPAHRLPAHKGRSLILLGHGSHLNANSSEAVRGHAAAVRATHLFDEVLEASWKEEPSLREVLGLAQFCDVTAVPLFVSEGYFTGTVIPRELGLEWRGRVPPEGVTEVLEGRRVHYTRPYGVHPAMAGVIRARAAEVCPEWSAADTALIVLGHGTGRDAQSQQAIEAAAAALRGTGEFAEVAALYLDQEPRVERWPELVGAPRVVIVPFFASEGWHTQETIPADLELDGPRTELTVNGGPRTVFYARPVGTHPAVTEVIVSLVAACKTAAAPVHPAWAEAGAALTAALERAGAAGLRVGEVQITPLEAGGHDLRHVLDAGRRDLQPIALRELGAYTGRTAAGEHRPIRTQLNLRRGWRTLASAGEVRRALQAVYPSVLEQAAAAQAGQLQPTPWPDTAGRQSGIYSRVGDAPPETVAQVQAELCSRCARTPLWPTAANKPSALLDATFLDESGGLLPCPEACTLLVSAVREAMPRRKSPKEAPHD